MGKLYLKAINLPFLQTRDALLKGLAHWNDSDLFVHLSS